MELRHLRYFVAVAEELHFGHAADRLNIAQSPLSQQVRQLEDEIGAQLFARTTRKVALTPAGEALLPRARRALAEAAEGADVARRAERGEVGHLRVGFVDSAAYRLLPRLLPAFHRSHPDVGVGLREQTTTEQLAALGTYIDVGIVRDVEDADGLELTPLLTERLVAAVPLAHRLSDHTDISIVELADDPFIVFPRDRIPIGVDRFLQLCRTHGFSPRIGQRVLQHATILGLVEASYGVALLPESVRDSARPGIVFLGLQEPEATSTLALVRPVAEPAPLAARFVATAVEVVAQGAPSPVST